MDLKILFVIFGFIIMTSIAVDPITPEEPEENFVEYDDADENLSELEPVEGEEEIYASEFPYGMPIGKFKVEERNSRKNARQGRAHIRIVHKWNKPRIYAKKYRTWKPAKEFIKPVPMKIGPKKIAPVRIKKPHRRIGPQKRRKVKPFTSNHLRRPTPPPEPDYDYVSEEEYFPEESKRNEFEYAEQKPYKKKGSRRRPSKISHEERIKEDTGSISYSNFVQHPGSTSSSASIDYADFIEEERPKPKERRRKKKRKGSSIHPIHHPVHQVQPHHPVRFQENDEDQFGAYSESSEETTMRNVENKYPPYYDETPHNRPIRRPTPTAVTPIYGEGYLGNQGAPTKVPQVPHVPQGNHIRGFDRDRNNGLGQFRNDINSGAAQTFESFAYEPTGYNNFGGSTNRPQQRQPDIITQQNYHQFQNQEFSQNQPQYNTVQVSSPNYNAINNLNQQATNTYIRPTHYNQNVINRTPNPLQNQNAHTYQNVVSPTREYSSRYNSNSFFDNTDSFQEFNQNSHYQDEKQYGAKKGRPNDFIPSHEYQEQREVENEFINRHLDLYSNGMSGVPIQGDGYANDRRQGLKQKDYDIGYGEIHYDESHQP